MNLEVLGIGNPIIDMYARIGSEQLHCIQKYLSAAEGGGTFHVQEDVFDDLLTCLEPEHTVPGGGAVNTIRILSQLGHTTGFIGGLGEAHHHIFSRELQLHGIVDYTSTFYGRPCGRSICVQQGPHSVLIFNPAAAAELQQLEPQVLQRVKPKLIYIEGFVLPRYPLIRQLLEGRSTTDAQVAVDLGAAAIAGTHKDFLLGTVLPAVSYLFGTEAEIEALEVEPSKLLSILKSSPLGSATLVVKRGALGSTIYTSETSLKVPPCEACVRDTIGAGDAYAAFYLSAILRGESVHDAAQAASYGSSLTLSRFGGKIGTDSIQQINTKNSRHRLNIE